MSSPLTETPEQLVQRQVDAYNRRDIDAFLSTYHVDIEAFDFPAERQLQGMEAMRQRYTRRFESPELHAQIHSRTVLGNLVIDHESVTGAADVASQAVVIYEIEESRIRRVYFLVR